MKPPDELTKIRAQHKPDVSGLCRTCKESYPCTIDKLAVVVEECRAGQATVERGSGLRPNWNLVRRGVAAIGAAVGRLRS